jgi:glycosyltransferase involved in cell wall biosynthesis
MRVLHIGKFYPPHPGGIERTSADLCSGLAARAIQTAMLAHAEPGSWRTTKAIVDDVDLTLTACPGQLLYAPVSPTFGYRLKKTIARFKPDILHLHVPNTSAFAVLMPSPAKKIPWVVHWHADIPLDSQRVSLRWAYKLYRPWEQTLLRRADAVIATSDAYRDSSSALAPWRDKTHVIPLGIGDAPTSSPNRIQWPACALRLLAVGRLSYFKGFDVLLRALARVPDAGLVLIGDGECAGDLRRLAGELNIESRVNFVGRLDMSADDQATLASAYAEADVFCLPSTERAESFGIVLLEAMRASLPTIASAVPGSGVTFVVRDGQTGLLVPPGLVIALANAIERLRDDATLRTHLGAAGRQRYVDEFTLPTYVDRTIALYREVLERTSHRAGAMPAA